LTVVSASSKFSDKRRGCGEPQSFLKAHTIKQAVTKTVHAKAPPATIFMSQVGGGGSIFSVVGFFALDPLF
jgi:hypothetical protein